MVVQRLELVPETYRVALGCMLDRIGSEFNEEMYSRLRAVISRRASVSVCCRLKKTKRRGSSCPHWHFHFIYLFSWLC
jgi:hypothetical protein